MIAITLFTVVGSNVYAQLPNPFKASGSKAGNRLPDDDIEGTIWEYKGTLKKQTKTNAKAKELKGRFRLEDQKVLDVGRRLPIPSKKDVKKTVEKLRSGELDEIKLPEGPQVKRLGQFRRLSRGRIRLDLDDKDSLNGIQEAL